MELFILRIHGEACNAMLSVFGAIRQIRTIYVFDEDIDIHDERQVEGAMCTHPFGKGGEMIHTRCAAKVFCGLAHYQTVEQALEASPLFYSHLVEAVGSTDAREVAAALEDLRNQGKLGRYRDGRYHLAQATPGTTGIVGELYHDPNHGT